MSSQGLVTGIPKIPLVKHVCGSCAMGKQQRNRFPKAATHPATQTLEVIHSDLCGPFPSSILGYRYFVTFIDEYTRKCWVYFMIKKSETLTKFDKFRRTVEKLPDKKIGSIRSDRGGEYLSTAFISYCKLHGIHRQLTAGYSPQQNGIAERKNCTLVEMTRTLVLSSNIPAKLWDETLRTACYI
jgi:transposase InsO family protein